MIVRGGWGPGRRRASCGMIFGASSSPVRFVHLAPPKNAVCLSGLYTMRGAAKMRCFEFQNSVMYLKCGGFRSFPVRRSRQGHAGNLRGRAHTSVPIHDKGRWLQHNSQTTTE